MLTEQNQKTRVFMTLERFVREGFFHMEHVLLIIGNILRGDNPDDVKILH